MRNKKNFLFQTFIGLDAEVTKSSDRNLIGTKGRIVDETKNLFIIQTSDAEKKIPKKSCSFLLNLDDGKHEINGKKIAFRPAERPKKVKAHSPFL